MNYNYEGFDQNEWLYKKPDEKLKRFLRKVFDSKNETRPAIIRNPGCKITEKALEYLEREWGVNLCDMPIDIQTKAMDLMDDLIAKGDSIPNIAAKMFDVIPPL